MSILLLGLIQNMALLITLAVVYSVVSGTMRRDDPRSLLLSGPLFGLMGVLVMMTPVTFHPGVIYDGRSIVLTLAGCLAARSPPPSRCWCAEAIVFTSGERAPG